MQKNGNGRGWDWSIEQSICSARNGSSSAVGQLLDHYRPYLLAIAIQGLPAEVAQKFAPSDLVQETCYQATRDFPKFAGSVEAELRKWLRQILIHNLRDVQKQFQQTQMRNCSRELSLNRSDDPSDVAGRLVSLEPSPSHFAMVEELHRSLALAIQSLSDEQRRVIELRSFEGMPFEEVGLAIGKSAEATRKLWVRAIGQLSDGVGADDSSPGPQL